MAKRKRRKQIRHARVTKRDDLARHETALQMAEQPTTEAPLMPQPGTHTPSGVRGDMVEMNEKPAWEVAPHRPHTVWRAKSRVHLGEWEQLAELDGREITTGGPVTELHLLAAIGHLQIGDKAARDRARMLLREAMEAGANRKLIARMLLAGASSTLGRLAALSGRPDQKVLEHFRSAISISETEADADFLLYPIAARQLMRLASNSRIKSIEEMARRTALKIAFSETEVVGNADPQASASPSVQGALVEFSLMLNSEVVRLGFTPSAPDAFCVQDGQLSFALARGQPAYLVSNHNGNFNNAPHHHGIPLRGNTAYEFSGKVACQSETLPIVWLFEYAAGKKIAGHSLNVSGGYFKALLRTHPSSEQGAIGLRVSGQGLIEPEQTHLELRTNSDIALAESLQAQVSQLGQRLEESLIKHQKKQSDNQIAQIESFIRLQNYMGADMLMPDMHGWPISPDLGLLLVRLFEAEHYDAVVEFGSGVSTLILAKAIRSKWHKQRGKGEAQAAATPFVSFDHLEQYHAQTAQQLAQAGLAENVDLFLAPLVPYQGPDGNNSAYYDCLSALRQLAESLEADQPRIFVLVDGPPAATCTHARYPALPVVQQAFDAMRKKQVELHVLMDDFIRDDERQIVDTWSRWLGTENATITREVFGKLEKQACLLKVSFETA